MNALFLVVLDFELLDFTLVSDIVNLFAFLVDNRKFTTLFLKINTQ